MGRARALLLALLLILPALCAASKKGDQGAAKRHYALAMRHYQAQQFEEAIREFEVTYEMAGKPVLLYNIAQAYRKLDKGAEALAYYEKYLDQERRIDVKKRRTVEGYVVDLKAQLAAQAALRAEKDQERIAAERREREATERREAEAAQRREAADRAAAEQEAAERARREEERTRREAAQRAAKRTQAPDLQAAQATGAGAALGAGAARTTGPGAARRPLHKRWELWTAISGVAAAGVVLGVVLGTQLPADPYGGQVPDARVSLEF